MNLAKRFPELLTTFITEKACEISLDMTKAILDREGIAHCKKCIQRFGLRKANGAYYCQTHWEEANR